MSADSVAVDQIRAFFDRWQRLEEEKTAISGDLKELFAEAKANGFDTKVLRKLFRDQVADSNERSEFEALYDLYASALNAPGARDARDAREDDPATKAKRSAALDALAAMDAEIIDAETGVIIEQAETPNQSTAARKDVPQALQELEGRIPCQQEGASDCDAVKVVAGTQAPPVDTTPDHSKPNPICRDPDDCGVYASWHLPCERRLKAAEEAA